MCCKLCTLRGRSGHRLKIIAIKCNVIISTRPHVYILITLYTDGLDTTPPPRPPRISSSSPRPHSLIEGCFDSGSRSTLPHSPYEPGSPAVRHTAPSWDFQEILRCKAIKQNCVRFWRLGPGRGAMTSVFPRLI